MESLPFRLDKVIELNEKCPIHDCAKWAYPPRNTVICPECVANKIMLEENEMILKGKRLIAYHEKQKRRLRFEQDNVIPDPTLYQSTLKNYEVYNDEMKLNLQKAEQLAVDCIEGKPFMALMQGETGTGKSHLAMGVLRYVNDYFLYDDKENPKYNGYGQKVKHRCCFYNVPELMRKVKGTWGVANSNELENAMFDRITSADLLVLDDLGAETSAMGRAEQAKNHVVERITRILNARQGRQTIITTNLKVNELESMYDKRVFSRIMAGANGYGLTFYNTPDMRRKAFEGKGKND